MAERLTVLTVRPAGTKTGLAPGPSVTTSALAAVPSNGALACAGLSTARIAKMGAVCLMASTVPVVPQVLLPGIFTFQPSTRQPLLLLRTRLNPPAVKSHTWPGV